MYYNTLKTTAFSARRHDICCRSFTNIKFTVQSLSVSLGNHLTRLLLGRCGINVYMYVFDHTAARNIGTMSLDFEL